MRKWIAVIALAVLICTLHTGVRGAENGLAMEDVTVQEGETVYEIGRAACKKIFLPKKYILLHICFLSLKTRRSK